MKINLNKKYRICISLLFIFMLACTDSKTIRDFHSISSEGWYKRSAELFAVQVRDTLACYDVAVNIRHDTHFRYQDLWLYVSYATPFSDSVSCDTVKIPIADKNGRWLGKGWGSLYQVSASLRNPLTVLRGDSAILSVRPAMKDDYLKGITEIGITLNAQPF